MENIKAKLFLRGFTHGMCVHTTKPLTIIRFGQFNENQAREIII